MAARRRAQPDSQFEDAVEARVYGMRVRREAERRHRAEFAVETSFALPKPGRTLEDDLAVPRENRRYTVDKLHISGGNTVLVAQHKAGKTTLEMNLVKALADHEPFLGKFDVADIDGRVGFLNYEMRADQFRDWMRDLAIGHPERVAEPLHLRGWSFPFWEPEMTDAVARWLRRNRVKFLIVDTAAAAWRGLVESENDNSQVAEFTHHLDAVKRAGKVDDLLIAHHTGRARQVEGSERGRGATRLEDWMDHGWYFVKEGTEGARRTFRALGRDVDVEALDISYDAGNRRITCTGETRVERRASEGIGYVLAALRGLDRPNSTELSDAMRGEKSKRSGWIKAAEDEALIRREYEGRSLVCELTDEGRVWLRERGK